jgi:tRNA (adenine57-N1/adenine58-N1)-methyltransferase
VVSYFPSSSTSRGKLQNAVQWTNLSRWQCAKEELASLGCENVVCTNRDAYNDGFIMPGQLELGQADGVFLDLPSPWLAVPHVKAILKRGGKVCNFSPCIEQVQKTILELSKAGFGDFKTIECIQRNYERRMTKRNNIYSGLDSILKSQADLPDEEKTLT